VRIDDLDYELPASCIAQEPTARREDARLLVLDPGAAPCRHRTIQDLPAELAPGDLLVLNDTRVLAARLDARRDTGGRVEVLALEPRPDGGWSVLARAGGTLRAGEVLRLAEGAAVRLVASLGSGRWVAQGVGADLGALLERHGRMPLPPYIRREPGDARLDALDRERYQTVFASHDGAVAAPTAGLHLTPALLDALAQRGIEVAKLTLHVGLGTFEPVRTQRLEDHPMHTEAFEVPAATADAVRRTRAAGGRVVAVGTTTVRALEASAAASDDGLPRPGAARTDLLIAPGYLVRVVDVLLTNFHLPRSTLLALVSALAGRERILAAYAEAVREGYRFYSYGDAMLIVTR
jgi:S-adenosylmethionine:tRNA ribosyltransferase-isomerase